MFRGQPIFTPGLVEHAKEQGKGEVFSRAVYQAYFQEGENIGDLEVILSLAEQVGLDRPEVQEHLQARTYAARIQTFQQEAHSRGVSGVPTFVIGPAQIVGAQSPGVFISMLKRIAERGLAG